MFASKPALQSAEPISLITDRNPPLLKVALNPDEQALLGGAVRRALVSLHPDDRQDQARLCGLAQALLADGVLGYAPRLERAVSCMRADVGDAVYATGLPTDPGEAALMALILGYGTGWLFNYLDQNHGDLLQRLRPLLTGPANSQASRDEHRPHTDDAALPESCRVQTLSLYGVVNPPGTHTSYACLSDARALLSPAEFDTLFEPRWQVKAPNIFGWGDDAWTGPRALFGRDELGRVTAAWPSYNTRALDPDDVQANQAAAALEAAVLKVSRAWAVDPGCWLSFSNLRGVHARTAVGKGDRLLYRTLARDSLKALRRLTGSPGPVFDARKLVQR